MHRILLLISFFSCFAAQTTLADEATSVTTSASATETTRPTKAAFDVTILNSAAAATTVRTDSAKVTAAVKSALLAAGLPESDLRSSQLNIGIHWDYVNNESRKNGFDASNRLHIETRNLALVGVYLDAALSGGAREVSAVAFTADDTDATRRRALAHAVAAAKDDAKAMAEAGGTRLGALVSLSTQPLGQNFGGEIQVTGLARAFGGAAAPAPATTVIIPDIEVTATVYGRWQVVSSAH